MDKLTVTSMRKHLVKLNKMVREAMTVKGVAKLSAEDIKKHFNERFKKVKHKGVDVFMPKGKYAVGTANTDDFLALLPKSMQPKKETPKAPTPKKETPKAPATPSAFIKNLPPELQAKIGNQAIARGGQEVNSKYLMAKRYSPKYIKLNDMWKELRNIQKKYMNNRYYTTRDMERLIKAVKKQLPKTASDMFEDFTKYLENLIKKFEAKQREDEAKQRLRREKNPDKVNVDNVTSYIDYEKLYDYPETFDDVAVDTYGTAYYGINENQFERVRDVVDNKMHKADRKAVADFIKKNKSIKTAKAMGDAFMKKYKNENYNIFDWM